LGVELSGPVAGKVEVLPRASETDTPDAVKLGGLDQCLAPRSAWYEPAYWFGPDPWDAGVELGINGSEGNNSVFSMRAGGHLKRQTKRWKYDSSLVYNKNHTNGLETQNNGKLDARLDRNIADSRWILFVLENLIYDEFQAYDLQLSLNSGVGYHLIKTPATDLTGRVGAGATREFGGVDNDWEAAGALRAGSDARHQSQPAALSQGRSFPGVGGLSELPHRQRRELGGRSRPAQESEPEALAHRPLRQYARRGGAEQLRLRRTAALEAVRSDGDRPVTLRSAEGSG
jgi:hypothetical protein